MGPTGFVPTEMTGSAAEGTIPHIYGISGRVSKKRGFWPLTNHFSFTGED